jgi:hypothetical protein
MQTSGSRKLILWCTIFSSASAPECDPTKSSMRWAIRLEEEARSRPRGRSVDYRDRRRVTRLPVELENKPGTVCIGYLDNGAKTEIDFADMSRSFSTVLGVRKLFRPARGDRFQNY